VPAQFPKLAKAEPRFSELPAYRAVPRLHAKPLKRKGGASSMSRCRSRSCLAQSSDEVAGLAKAEALVFALVPRPRGAEGVLLNQDSPSQAPSTSQATAATWCRCERRYRSTSPAARRSLFDQPQAISRWCTRSRRQSASAPRKSGGKSPGPRTGTRQSSTTPDGQRLIARHPPKLVLPPPADHDV
jgi:hypothetical protein